MDSDSGSDNEIEIIQFNETNETIFWKVFKNKFLVHLIFQQIGSINLETEKETIKFKDIQSFKWMYEKQENELLKCKLEASESITEIDKESLSNLFYQILLVKPFYESDKKQRNGYFQEVCIYKTGDEYLEEDETKEHDNENKKKHKLKVSSFKKSFDLLVKHKPDQLIEVKVIDIIIGLYIYMKKGESFLLVNQFIQQLLSNEPFNNSTKLIDSNSIGMAIDRCPPCILETLLGHCKKVGNLEQVITNELKNKSIFKSSKSDFKNQMISFIMNEPMLFNSQSPSTSIPITLPPMNAASRKRLKMSKLQSPHSKGEEIESNKINISDFVSVRSTTIQILLLQNYFVKMDNETTLPDETKTQVLEFLNGIKNDNSHDEMEKRIKSLYLIYSEEEKNYNLYFEKYGQIHEKMTDLAVWTSSMQLRRGYGLKHLLSKDKKQLKQVFERKVYPGSRNKEAETFSISNETTEFIKYYTTGHHYFILHEFDTQLLNYSLSCDQKDYEKLLESIVVTSENNKFTSLLLARKTLDGSISLQSIKDSKNFVIKDTKTIDLLSGCLDTFVQLKNQFKGRDQNNYKLFNQFKFETYQLIDYAKSKYGSLFFSGSDDNDGVRAGRVVRGVKKDKIVKKDESSFYLYPWTRAINNCDIESLKHIDQTVVGTKFDKFQGCKSIDDSVYSEIVLQKIKQVKEFKKYSDKIKINFNYNKDGNCKEKVIQLLDYLNGTDYKLFSLNLFKKFISDIARLEFIDQPILKSIKFPSHFGQSSSFELLLESISNNQVSSSKVIQMIVENGAPFSIKSSNAKPIFEKWESGYDGLFDQSYYQYIIEAGEFEIFPQSSLYYLVERRDDMLVCESFQSIPDVIKSIELILNQFSINYKSCNKELNLMVSKLVNYLFKRLIKISGLTSDQVLNNYQFINSKWKSITGGLEFKFQHSLYHVFFYLLIKSEELIDLIFDQLSRIFYKFSGNYWFDNEWYKYEDDGFFDGDDKEDGEDLSIVRALKPDIFTFDFIFNSTEKQVIGKLKCILSEANGRNDDR